MKEIRDQQTEKNIIREQTTHHEQIKHHRKTDKTSQENKKQKTLQENRQYIMREQQTQQHE